MKIKALVLAAALLAGATAFAQETNRDANGNIQYGSYETNKFLQNWFVGAGVGANFTVTNAGTGFAFPTIDVNLGKWIEPCFGLRVGAQTFSTKVAGNDPLTNIYVHGDALWNLSNQIWGYSEVRKYNFIPYAHMGLFVGGNGGEFAAGAGILNNIALTKALKLVIDLRATVAKAEQFGAGSGPAANLAATIGLSYDLGKNNWTRTATTAAIAAAALAAEEAARNAAQASADKANAQAKSLADQLAGLEKENANLKDDLAKAMSDNEAISNALYKTQKCVYFEIGQAKLSKKELSHLEYIVKTALDNGKNLKFTIAGNADSKTGSKKRNQKLSQMRADYVMDILTNKYGLNPDNFTVVANGGNDVFSTQELNRAVIIDLQ